MMAGARPGAPESGSNSARSCRRLCWMASRCTVATVGRVMAALPSRPRLKVLEPGVLLQGREIHRTNRTVALLADDDLRHAFIFGPALAFAGLVHLFTIDEHDHV